MFRSKSGLQEERIKDLKAAHMRLVVALTDEIEYLRSQLNPTTVQTGRPQTMPPWPDETGGPTNSLSEEEEQILALREFGHIDGSEADIALQGLKAHGITVSDITRD